MLEILFLVGLCKTIGRILERKGRRSGWFKFLVVIAWFGGELAGAVVAAIAAAIMNPQQEPPMGAIYISALVGAGLSVGFVFLVASLLSDLRRVEPSFGPTAAPLAGLDLLGDPNNPYRAPS